MDPAEVRIASHAGSWYQKETEPLNKMLSTWLDGAEKSLPAAKALISPHAGYSYCAKTAAHAYKHVDTSNIKTVFVLGPSHKVYITDCALSKCKYYDTPFGNITLNRKYINELNDTGKFHFMTVDNDENEHSLEMQVPFIKKVFDDKGKNFDMVPVMVGHLDDESVQQYGEIFRPYLENPENLFVISSDFCHWGHRFKFTTYNPDEGEIYESIEALDRRGMNLIENQEVEGFREYLTETKNTICGRNPISIFLSALKQSNLNTNTKFVHYSQSGRVTEKFDSSVSYAAGVTFLV